MKAQISAEMLMTLGMILAFTAPIILLLLSVSQQSYESSTLSQADASAKILADNINDVYSQGIGAKKTILISFPVNMESLTIQNKEVVVKLKTSNGIYEVVSPIFANATIGQINGKSGLLTIILENQKSEVYVYG